MTLMESSSLLDDELSLQELMSMAEDAARLAARNYTGIDAEDIQSAIMETVCRRPDRIERHLEHKGWLWSVFYGEAIAYCNQQVRNFMYYSGEYYYTPQEVRDLLQRAYDGDVNLEEVIHITEATISAWDLYIAFNRLNFREKDLIVRKYQRKEKLDASDRRAFYRATERLAQILNRDLETGSRSRVTHEGPGGRQSVSNEKARNMTEM
jgi:DNA-directed RNA polymerase specialized sigma24 family protein